MKDNRLKQAEWVLSPEYMEETDVRICSACKEEAYSDTDYGQVFFGYCPYCGAKMMNVKKYKLIT